MTAADPSTSGHYTVAGLNSSNQFVAFQTTNSGQTWSAAGAPVTDSTSLTKGHTWMNYSSTGALGLMWKSNQADGGFKVYAAFTGNGGNSWMNPGAIEVSSGTSPSAPTAQYGPFIGVSDDYSHIAMGPDVAQVTWADWRPGDRQGFVSAVRFLNYDFGGFLPPVAKGAAVNAGSVVPVKFQLSVKGQNVSWATGTVTVYADGTSLPVASNLNYVKGQTVPNLVIAPVGGDPIRRQSVNAATDIDDIKIPASVFTEGRRIVDRAKVRGDL